MDREGMMREWRKEQAAARICGWDFSHIQGRYAEDGELPWVYEEIIRRYLRPEMKLLDIDTGGGEFLLSLGHPYENTAATEAYGPNVLLCERTLLPRGVDFREGRGAGPLPFENGKFDMVIDRHGEWNAEEIYRVLRPGGVFVTQQVGAENDRELVELLMGDAGGFPFPKQYLRVARRAFEEAGFSVLDGQEAYRTIRFYDVGALVWFARIIEWEFPGFSVETCLSGLERAQTALERDGAVCGRTHRFLLAARKGT